MQLSDAELVARYLETGDERAFRTLVERHQERLFGYLLGMVQDRDVANDLFQDTFVRAIKAMHKQRGNYTAQGRWVHWVMRIARNAALDYLRSRKRWRTTLPKDEGEDERESYWDRLPDQEPNAAEQLHRTEQEAWLKACIDQLPPDQREVLLMRHEGELTFREIAELTDCSINTALGRMRYALQNLRRLMTASKKSELGDLEYAP
jgi:RNA polymerase sigma-70 factor (ECF subfamily)